MSKYHVEVSSRTIDFYDIWDAYHVDKPYQIGDAAIEHACKKLMLPGQRHSKDRMQDIDEAIASLYRAKQQIELEGEASSGTFNPRTGEYIGE